jgi:hypothetical protein
MKMKIGTKTGEYRYVAPPACSPDGDRPAYYRTHKGEYIKNEIGKDGKFTLPVRFYPSTI